MTATHSILNLDKTRALFARTESRVRSYCRGIPAVFDRAEGARLYDVGGRSYIDFLSGAGSLNYGHNHPLLLRALIEYLQSHGVAHSLDLHTRAKAHFLEALERSILRPRNLDYVAQFTGPTGTNAVEAALKIARKITGRSNVIAFTNGFHGVSLGALAATGNRHHRAGAAIPLSNVSRMPFDGYLGAGIDTLAYLEKTLDDASSGVDMPAAVIIETVQGEGGLNVAGDRWLQGLSALCRRHDIILIVDDIQAGCGRTGTFFSFEPAGIRPDIVTLSKSLSGLGIPFAVTLIRRDLDQWRPGEHNGTFRGNNHAFVTASAAIEHFWRDDAFAARARSDSEEITRRLDRIVARHGDAQVSRRGRGFMQGLAFTEQGVAERVSRRAFECGLIIETSGPRDDVVKCLCPLTIPQMDLDEGFGILSRCVDDALRDQAVGTRRRQS